MDINRLIESFLKFPGIGPRQAKRFVYFLAGESKEYVDNLAKLIAEIKSGMKQCESCYRYFESKNAETDLCPVCSGASRDSSVIMAVAKDVELTKFKKKKKITTK